MQPYTLNLESAGQGRPLVLIHGVAGSLRIWDRVVPYLSEHYRVHRLDLLGYGHSPKPHLRYTPQTHVHAIRATLQAHGIAPPYTLIGLSMGLDIALEYAATWPEEVVGFIGIAFPYYADEAAAREGLRHDFWARLSLDHPVLARFAIPTLWWLGRIGIVPTQGFTQIYSRAMARDALRCSYQAFSSSLHECMLNNRLDRLLEASAALPRLFIHGADDTWATTETVRGVLQTYPASRLVVLPDTGHNTAVVNAKATAEHILTYLHVD